MKTLRLFSIVLAAWAVPGLGHLLLRRWRRALALAAAVATLAAAGVLLRGRLFSAQTEDFFDLLGFLADCGAGLFFLAARWVENGGADVSRAAGDFGTRFFAAAGVLNLLCLIDAHQIASGGKS
jgi:hypothetical protein